MKTLRTLEAFYPAFPVGHEPMAVPCTLAVVTCDLTGDKEFFKTPFAFLDAHGELTEESLARLTGHDGKYLGYYLTEEACKAYLAAEYPNWELAAPIMDALHSAIHFHGTIVGPCRVADKCGVTTDGIYPLARGKRQFKVKEIKRAVKALTVLSGLTV